MKCCENQDPLILTAPESIREIRVIRAKNPFSDLTRVSFCEAHALHGLFSRRRIECWESQKALTFPAQKSIREIRAIRAKNISLIRTSLRETHKCHGSSCKNPPNHILPTPPSAEGGCEPSKIKAL
jgi:hypothetical protein